MAKAKKTKSKALPRVPQSREDAVWTIGRIGTLQREIAAHKAAADEVIRSAGEKFDNDVADLAEELAQHEDGIRVYCEANRMKLTDDGKVKYHNFGTGTVKWRLRPPSVKLKGVELIIEQCRKLGFLAMRKPRSTRTPCWLIQTRRGWLLVFQSHPKARISSWSQPNSKPLSQ